MERVEEGPGGAFSSIAVSIGPALLGMSSAIEEATVEATVYP
jgi:hypothetical protein